MQRIPEPELMTGEEQARAYAEADFSEPHDRFVALLREALGEFPPGGCILDLGCGPGDVTLRVARAFPACEVHGVDGAEAMLRHGWAALPASGVGDRVKLLHGYLPGARLPRTRYEAIISNSLLHHLDDPMVLWHSIRDVGAPGAPVFVMDLTRPASEAEARRLREEYAAGEPPVLQEDFYRSLLAAYTPEEVRGQLLGAGLDGLSVQVVSDRHLTVHGFLP